MAKRILKVSKKKGYAEGGVIAPESLTPEQLLAFEKFATDAEKMAYLESLGLGDMKAADAANGLTGKQKAIASLAPVVGGLGAAGVNAIDVDPLNKNANIAQGAGAGALKGAGQGLALGMNPALMAATGGLSAPIGAAAGAVAGGVSGGIKGKKKYTAAKGAADDEARANAMAASYKDSGYADGGTIAGAAKKQNKGVASVSSVYTPTLGIDLKGGAGVGTALTVPYDPTAIQSSPGPIMLFGEPYAQPLTTTQQVKGMKDGGKVVGPGTGKSDDVPARVEKGSFIVPVENAKIAEQLREQYLTKTDGKANLKQTKANVAVVPLSNGEHMFTPAEVKILKAQGIDVDGLAPNSETTGYGYADGGTVKPSKARKILSDGKIRGKDLTPKQQRYFGWIAGKGMKDGGYADGGPVTSSARQSQINQRLADLDAAEAKEKSKLKQGERFDDKQWYADINAEREALKAEQSVLTSQYGSVVPGKEVTLPDDYKTTAPIYQAKADVSSEADAGKLSKGAGGRGVKAEAPAKTPIQVSSGRTGGGGSKTETGTTPEMLAYQQAFIKEHGGIAGSATEAATGTAATPEGESRFKAVASDPVDALLKKYDELTLAGKVGEAAEIEKQIADLGGKARLTAHKSKAAGSPVAQTSASIAETDATDIAANSPSGIPPSPIKKAYEAIGPAGLLAIGQVGLGAIQSARAKAPTPEIDPVLLQRRNEAMQKANMGLSPAEYANAANRIESNRSNAMRAITGVAGGDVGTIVGNARMASIDANRSRLDLEAANERMKQQNASQADNLIAAVAQQRQQVFAQNMNMFNQQQAASSALMGAGLENLFGSISSRENQDRIDQRAEKYGTVNFTFPGTT